MYAGIHCHIRTDEEGGETDKAGNDNSEKYNGSGSRLVES